MSTAMTPTSSRYENNAGSAHKADPAFLPWNNCGWQRVAVPMIACRWCGHTSHAAVIRAENNLSLEPTGKCRGTHQGGDDEMYAGITAQLLEDGAMQLSFDTGDDPLVMIMEKAE